MEAPGYYIISLFLGGLIALGSGGFVFFKDTKKQESISWMLLNLATAIWSFGYYSMIRATSHEVGLISNWILHIGSILIPPLYFYFIISLTKTYEKYLRLLKVFLGLALVFLFLSPSTLFVRDVVPKYPFPFVPDAGLLYSYYTIFFFAVTIFSGFILIKVIQISAREEARRLRFVLASSAAGFIGGSSVFLLTFNIPIPPYLLALFTFYPVIITYAILKHNLFDTKVISTEILVFCLWALLLFRTLLSDSQEQLFNLAFLTGSIVLGIFLIRSVIREVDSREKIEILAEDLAQANFRLKELDKMKSEFVSVASHQLRSPLTAIKGYSSLLLEGSFGALAPNIKDPLDRIFQASRSMASLIEDFLNITRIEQGRMKYQFGAVELYSIIASVIREFIPNTVRAGLLMEFTADATKKYTVWGDAEKLKQVVSNLLDNAIKYSKRGRIMVKLQPDESRKKFIISVLDSGIGIPLETLPKLFEKFNRSENANQVSVVGTGLGLYIAKEMIKAHNGRIWAESGGPGRGSTFFVELNMASVGDMASSEKMETLAQYHAEKIARFAKEM